MFFVLFLPGSHTKSDKCIYSPWALLVRAIWQGVFDSSVWYNLISFQAGIDSLHLSLATQSEPKL